MQSKRNAIYTTKKKNAKTQHAHKVTDFKPSVHYVQKESKIFLKLIHGNC